MPAERGARGGPRHFFVSAIKFFWQSTEICYGTSWGKFHESNLKNVLVRKKIISKKLLSSLRYSLKIRVCSSLETSFESKFYL
jgi:hypothetical protein